MIVLLDEQNQKVKDFLGKNPDVKTIQIANSKDFYLQDIITNSVGVAMNYEDIDTNSDNIEKCFYVLYQNEELPQKIATKMDKCENEIFNLIYGLYKNNKDTVLKTSIPDDKKENK